MSDSCRREQTPVEPQMASGPSETPQMPAKEGWLRCLFAGCRQRVTAFFLSVPFLVFVIAAAIYTALYLSPVSMLSRDSLVYLRELELWFRGGNLADVFDFGGPPLPLFLSKCLMLLGVSAHAAFVSLNIAAGAVVCALFYLLIFRIFADRILALGATAVLLCAPLLVDNTLQAQRDVPAVAFALAGILAFEAAVRTGRRRYWPVCGIFLAAILLCRFEYVEFLLFLPLAMLGSLLAGKISCRKFFLALGGVLLTACLTLVLALLSMGVLDFMVKKYSQKMQHYYRLHIIRGMKK